MLDHVMLKVSTILAKTGSYSFLHIAKHFPEDHQCYFVNNLCNTCLEDRNGGEWVLKNLVFDVTS